MYRVFLQMYWALWRMCRAVLRRYRALLQIERRYGKVTSSCWFAGQMWKGDER
jgi:hypothetical protein